MQRHGFTLVELSIVLVIIGLLVGGIMAGQSLIRNSEVKTVITESQKYKDALYAFRSKYAGWPGDLSDATSYWGVKASTGSDVTCHQTPGTSNTTCNGNGDGLMDQIAGDASYGERFLAWQQMVAAKIIEGQYTGASTTSPTYTNVPKVNVPAATIGNGAYWVINGMTVTTITGNLQWFDGVYPSNVLSVSRSLKPQEAWNVDSKVDDGFPATGKVVTLKSTATWSPSCATSDAVSAEYAVSNNTATCMLIFFIE